MPFIHITSLPFAEPFNASEAVVAIGEAFCSATGVASEHVTVTWRYLESGHYAVGGATVVHQPRDTHPLLVELLAPDFNSEERVATMLEAAAQSVAAQCGVPADNVFISFRAARSGSVFDAGEIVRWK